MFKTIKNQKGITLVELLAVMVIVGIIAAISIPAIGNLIENTRQDAFIATAKNLQESARLVAAQNDQKCTSSCQINFTATDDAGAVIGGANFIENLNGTPATVTVTNTGGNYTYSTTYTEGKYSISAVDAFDVVRSSDDTEGKTPITVK